VVFTTENWVHIIGTMGAAMLLLAYFLVSRKKLDGDSRTYQLLNIFGAAMLALLTFYTGAWAAMTLNVIWAIIGIVTIGKSRHEKSKNSA